MDPLASFSQITYYSQHFTDIGLWSPYVRQVCARHNLFPCQVVRMGIPGTFPTFIIEDRFVVKFYGQLFDGYHSFLVEKVVNQLVNSSENIPVPELINSGFLFDQRSTWPWPYLIFTFLPGTSIGEIFPQIVFEDKLKLADDLGRWIRRLHEIDLPFLPDPLLPNPLSSILESPLPFLPYRTFLKKRRKRCVNDHRQWGTLPDRLVDQINDWLPLVDALIPPGKDAYLIHADLTKDHIFGSLQNGHWVTSGIIDLGDAMLGDIYYELVALHLDLFAYDRLLLSAFLEAYGIDDWLRQDFHRKAMACTLLHRFNVLANLTKVYPEWQSLSNLNELAELIW